MGLRYYLLYARLHIKTYPIFVTLILLLSSFMDLPKENTTTDSALPKVTEGTVKESTLSGVLIAFGIGILIVAAIALLFGQSIGYQRGLSYAAEQAKKIAAGQEISASNVKALSSKVKVLQDQLTTAMQERDISLANLDTLQQSTKELQVTNLQLQQEQAFLTQAIAKKGGIALQLIGAKIAPLPENAYEYRFDVGRVDPTNQPKNLVAKLTLLDEVNMVEVPIQPNSYKINGVTRIRGRFIMPKDFTPKQVKLELIVGNEKIEQIYDWQLGQPIDNMPYSLEETPEADKRPVTDDTASVTASTPQ